MTEPVRSVGTLALALGATALCLALPAWLRFGPLGIEAVVLGFLACLIPGVLLAVLSRWIGGRQRSVTLMLIGTGLRVGFVLAVAMLMIRYRPALEGAEFLLGIAAFYLVALTVETQQLLKTVKSDDTSVKVQQSTRV